MKKRLLSIALVFCMLVSLIPLAAQAETGGNKGDFWNYRQKWLYTAVADKDAAGDEDGGEGLKKGTNLRDHERPAEQGAMPTQIFDLGTIDRDHPSITDANKLTITFKNITDNQYKDQVPNENNWGIVSLALPSSQYFHCEWKSGNNGRIQIGEEAQLEITPRTDATLHSGVHEETITIMEQHSRIGWAIKVKVTVGQTNITVQMPETVEKYYGQTLTADDIELTVRGESHTLRELGVYNISGDGVPATAEVGFDTYTVQPDTTTVNMGDYQLTITGQSKVKVKQTTPELEDVIATSVEIGHTLESSHLTGKYINPYTQDGIPGTFSWVNSSQTVSQEGEYQYRFTPSDLTNYTIHEDTVTVEVIGEPETTPATQTTLTIDESSMSATYNGHTHPVSYTTNRESRDDITVRYRPAGTHDWTQTAPKDAGSYDVRITAKATSSYTENSISGVLTIHPKTIHAAYSVSEKVYDGTTDGTLSSVTYRDSDILSQDQSGLALTVNGTEAASLSNLSEYFNIHFDSAGVGGNKSVAITPKHGTKLALTGSKAGNYTVTGEGTALASITPRPVYLTLNHVTKYYGQTMEFAASDFTAQNTNNVSGLVSPDTIDSLNLTVISSGTVSTAETGSHPVAVASGNPNYTAHASGKMEMTVLPAVPEGTVAALRGQKNTPISTLAHSLHGTFENPYDGEAVHGTVAWKDGSQKTPNTAGQTGQYEYIFTPTDSKNYDNATGTVEVTATEGQPAPIAITSETSLEYTGEPQPITVEPVAGVEFSVRYETKEGAETSVPVNAGHYQAEITATPDTESVYEKNTLTTDLIITPVVPEVTAKASAVTEGDSLAQSQLTCTATVNGKPVDGKIAWDDPLIVAEPDTVYSWTFTPADEQNYLPVSGDTAVEVKPKPDSPIPDPEPEPEPEPEPDPEPTPEPGHPGGGSHSGSGSHSSGSAGGSSGKPSTPPDNSGKVPALTPEASIDRSGTARAEVSEKDMRDLLEDLKEDGTRDTVVIVPQVNGESPDEIAVELQRKSVEDMSEAGLNLEVETAFADITIPAASLDKLADGKTVTVSARKNETTGRITIDVSVDGQTTGAMAEGLNVEIPGVKSGNVVVLVDANGQETVIKKSLVTGSTAEALLNGSCTIAVRERHEKFADVNAGDWFNSAVDFATSHELFSGVGNNEFAPNEPMTRGMLATVLWNLENRGAAASRGSFSDVGANEWYADGIAWAASNGLVTGYGDGQFGPSDSITREQMAAILYGYAKQFGLETTQKGNLGTYRDSNSVDGWAREAMTWATGAGLLSGNADGTLNPTGAATRAEVAVILGNLIRLIVE